MDGEWCPVCCCRHGGRRRCPGELLATGPERQGFRVDVETPRGLEAYAVLVAQSDELWRARIMTFPNVLWLVPGGNGSVKFVGRSPREAEERAVQFIREHCQTRGFRVRNSVAKAIPSHVVAENAPAGGVAAAGGQAPRKVRFLPLRFGLVSPTEPGGTGNLSETGLFVITSSPLDPGVEVQMLLNLQPRIVSLEGVVRWMRPEHQAGRSPGMGVRLIEPASRYLRFVRDLS